MKRNKNSGGMQELLQMYQMFSPEQTAREQLLQQQLASQQQEMDIRGQMSPLQLQMLQAQYDAQQQQQAQQGVLNPLMVQKLQQELAAQQQGFDMQQQIDPVKLQMLQQELSNQQLQGQGAQSQLDFNNQMRPLQLSEQALRTAYIPQQMESAAAMQQLQNDAYLTQKQAQLASMAGSVLDKLPQDRAIDLPGLQRQKQQLDNVSAFLPAEIADRIRGMYPATQLPPEQLQPFVSSMQANSPTPFVAGQQVATAIQQQPALQGSLSPMQQGYLKNYQTLASQPGFDPSQLPNLTPKDAEDLTKWTSMNPEQRQKDASPGVLSWLLSMLPTNPAGFMGTMARNRMAQQIDFTSPLPPNFYNR